jgi:hypothetical protein
LLDVDALAHEITILARRVTQFLRADSSPCGQRYRPAPASCAGFPISLVRLGQGDPASTQSFTISDVADHVERFSPIYKHALNGPADGGVYEALVRCFIARSMSVITRSAPPDLPTASHQVMAMLFAHGFAGAIKCWLSDDSVTKADLIDASVACAPAWWN